MERDEKQSESAQAVRLYIVTQAAIVAAMLVLGGIDLYQHGDDYEMSIMPYIGSLLEDAGVLAFGTIAIHLACQLWFSWRHCCVTTIAYLAVYVLSYSALSSAGQYHASRSGLNRWNSSGFAVIDEDVWHARGVFWQPFTDVRGERTSHATILGCFYSPLIRVDRRFWHDSFNMFEDDLDEWLAEHPNVI